MIEEKIKNILESLKGINKLEWTKIKCLIDRQFSIKENETTINDFDTEKFIEFLGK